MRRWSCLFAVMFAGCVVHERRVVPEAVMLPPPAVAVTVDDFEPRLSPYGVWFVVPGYGRVWQPAGQLVGPDFYPYGTRGHWVYTEAGWVFDTDFPFGWAVFHYGRWYFDAGYGWLWVPGTVWGPSWVAWRTGGAYVGWAPLGPAGPPEFHHHHWCFVETGHFTRANVHSHRVPEPRFHAAVAVTQPVHAAVPVGPPPAYVSAGTGTPIVPRPVNELRSSGRAVPPPPAPAREGTPPPPTSAGEPQRMPPPRAFDSPARVEPGTAPPVVAPPPADVGAPARIDPDRTAPPVVAPPAGLESGRTAPPVVAPPPAGIEPGRTAPPVVAPPPVRAEPQRTPPPAGLEPGRTAPPIVAPPARVEPQRTPPPAGLEPGRTAPPIVAPPARVEPQRTPPPTALEPRRTAPPVVAPPPARVEPQRMPPPVRFEPSRPAPTLTPSAPPSAQPPPAKKKVQTPLVAPPPKQGPPGPPPPPPPR